MEDFKNQNITLEGRKKLNITGVKEVENFDDNGMMLITELGTLSVRGNNVKIEKLNLDSEDIVATGDFYSLEYVNDENIKRGMLSKIFR